MDYEILYTYLEDIEYIKKDALSNSRKLRDKNMDIYHFIQKNDEDLFKKINKMYDYTTSIMKYRPHKKHN